MTSISEELVGKGEISSLNKKRYCEEKAIKILPHIKIRLIP